MRERSLDLVDVRLLRMFEAVYAERHVTRAAAALGLSQSTLSIGLGRLRTEFRDPLFVRTSEGMLATPLANALIEPVRDVLQAMRRVREVETAFDPATAVRLVRIAMTDASHIALLPRILEALLDEAKHVTLEAARIDDRIGHALSSGELDLALGLIPELGSGIYQQILYEQDFVCLTRANHPRIGAKLTRRHYSSEGHIEIISGTGHQLIDAAIAQSGIARRIVLRLPGFLGLTHLLSASDLIATVPRHIGTTLATGGSIKVHACPLPIPGFTVKQHWHSRYHHDPFSRWLRGLCYRLFRA